MSSLRQSVFRDTWIGFILVLLTGVPGWAGSPGDLKPRVPLLSGVKKLNRFKILSCLLPWQRGINWMGASELFGLSWLGRGWWNKWRTNGHG